MPQDRCLPLCLFPVILLVVSSCSTKSSDQKANEVAFDSVKLTPYSGNTAVALTHEVRDFRAWLVAYNNLSDPESRISIFSNPDNPNLITVFELTKGHLEARTALSTVEFRQTLEAEGVTTEPKISLFDIKFRATTPTEKSFRLGVSHEVADYELWKKIFDQDEPIRSKANLELRAISTNADNSLLVNIFFATDDIEKAKDVINSEELRKRMKEAGVISDPIFAVFRVPDPPSN